MKTPLTAAQLKALLGEKDRVARLGRIRQFVFGSLDGLLVPLGVVSGVAGGTGSVKAVIVAGLAEAFAGALSMGAGEFLSGRAEAQVQLAEVENEIRLIRANPEYEYNELIVILESEGVGAEDARVIADRLRNYQPAFEKMMVEKELGLTMEPDTVRFADSFIMGLSYMAASIVPLISYFFLPLQPAYIASLALTFLFLLGLGIVRGKLARINLLVSALEIVAVGTVSGLGGYFLGVYIPHLFGF
ncbi:MAG: VIT1/CCC1 transporter family protein [Chloroflexia bacterium]